MTPQHRASPHSTTQPGEEGSTHEKKKMKTMLQRRRTAQSVISRALSKPRAQSRAGISVERCPWHVNQPDMSVTHGSFFVMEEHVHLTNGQQTQERHLFLFTDILIIAKSKSSASLKVKAQVRLSEMWLASCVEQVTERKLSSRNSFVIGWPTTNYVVTLSSTEAKEKWLSTLKWYIMQSKQNDLPSKIVMRVTVLDDNVTTAALQLDSSSTAEKIIQMVALQHGLRGPPTEYELWVETAGEEAPRVLIGHEFPYSIVLHHLRASECLHMVRSSLLTAEGTLHLGLLPREIPVPRLTLRARSARHQPTQADLSQKQRRKRSFMDWALRRGTISQSSCPQDSLCSALFGQPLSSICRHGSPPQPVMDMLFVLYQQGPATQGIFRRSANAKSCRELKEKLNAGLEYLPEGESLFVIAAVFTDFLRSLPGSVLGSHLYERWMEAAEVEEEEERNSVIRSLVAELPEENGTLLRYVFWVLYRIHERSGENQMTASNLALCIAPNMLTLPSPCSAEEETKAMKKVAELIQVLIKNTPSFFGEDVGGLLSQWRNAREEGEETDLHANWRGQRVPSPTSLLPPDPLLLPLAMLSLREDGGFATPSGSSVSVCSLPGPAWMGRLCSSRDRCASEPTVCPTPPHAAVARQSSCDAAVMGGSTGQSHSPCAQARRLQPKQKAWQGDGSPSAVRAGKARHALWRSPQVVPRFRHAAARLPSLSSLSSTATSSLSSLDSALSLTSSEPLSSPNDTATARPFLFGTSARLRPLTPDVPKKFPPDWSMTFHHHEEEEGGEGEEEEEEEEEEWQEEDEKGGLEQAKRRGERGRGSGVAGEKEEVEAPDGRAVIEAEAEAEGSGSRWNGPSDVRMAAGPASPAAGDREQVQWKGEQNAPRPRPRGHAEARETSVTRIQLSGSGAQQTLARSDVAEMENLQRTKITFYTSSATLTVKEPAVRLATDAAGDSTAAAAAAISANPKNHTVRVHIPQMVFYGQNAPLVLRSVSTRVPASPGPTDAGAAHTRITLSGGVGLSNARHGAATANGAEGTAAARSEGASRDVIERGGVSVSPGHLGPQNSSSSNQHGAASAGIRHTIRIKLPTAVRNTVREYFSHGEAGGRSTNAQSAAVEKELIINRLQWQRRDPRCSPPESCPASASSDGEEPFI